MAALPSPVLRGEYWKGESRLPKGSGLGTLESYVGRSGRSRGRCGDLQPGAYLRRRLRRDFPRGLSLRCITRLPALAISPGSPADLDWESRLGRGSGHRSDGCHPGRWVRGRMRQRRDAEPSSLERVCGQSLPDS